MASAMAGDYVFPTNRVFELDDPTKTPLVLVACGSFSPLTFLHLRLFEQARDDTRFHNSTFSVIGGFLSPVNDAYSKVGLASAEHRVNMCQLAVDDTSNWLSVDSWEARAPVYMNTAKVLDHFDLELNEKRGGATCRIVGEDGVERIEKRKIRIMLLAGSDLICTMSEPGCWAEKDIHHILGLYGCYIIERSESELDQTIFSSSSVHSRSPVALYRHNIHMVDQLVRNDVSSTKVRMFVRKHMSVEYLIPGVVARYIERNGLYLTLSGKGGRIRDVEGAEWRETTGPASNSGSSAPPSRAASRTGERERTERASSIFDDKMAGTIAGAPSGSRDSRRED